MSAVELMGLAYVHTSANSWECVGWSRSDNIQKIGYISPGRWDSHHLHHQRLAALPELAVKKNGERRLTARRVWSRPHHRLRFDSALRSSSQATSSQAQDVQHM